MASRFSFLRFPQSKSLWTPLLRFPDNLHLTLGRRSHLPGPPRAHQRPSTAHRLGTGRGDPEMLRTKGSIYGP